MSVIMAQASKSVLSNGTTVTAIHLRKVRERASISTLVKNVIIPAYPRNSNVELDVQITSQGDRLLKKRVLNLQRSQPIKENCKIAVRITKKQVFGSQRHKFTSLLELVQFCLNSFAVRVRWGLVQFGLN